MLSEPPEFEFLAQMAEHREPSFQETTEQWYAPTSKFTRRSFGGKIGGESFMGVELLTRQVSLPVKQGEGTHHVLAPPADGTGLALYASD